jgi:DUF1365 family protein
MTDAAIIVGEVVHERLKPVNHRFSYPLFCLRIPLQALPVVAREMAVNCRGLVSFHERDHGARDGTPALTWVRSVLLQQGVLAHTDDAIDVVLYTFPRMLGYVFNPVSFWVCSASASADVIAVVVEVNNTFGESHSYLLTADNNEAIHNGQLLQATKQLHVSPFNEVRGGYKFRFHFGPERWLARIDYDDGNGALLNTHISGEAQPLTRANLRRAALRFPLQTLAVVARIHWHALRLFAKRVPFLGKLRSNMTGISRS